MIPKTAKLRVARPTDNLAKITDMYVNGLGFKLLGSFEGHNGFDGSIVGHEQHNYHLEFTHHKGTTVGKAPTQDNLLIFYFIDTQVWEECCEKMQAADFVHVPSYNDYWDDVGKTFEDVDGYRVVLQNREWTA
ncbi:MAG: VOC family protein [Gammaproteobacteria bacterium]|uniref:VOC family protein n=1 Tax=Marinomonas sp. ef1 TaxID=2005043 RepID=UPI000C28340A|nr:VOC family protein [Marinomonas sp. ef1]MBU1296125.1 VOC family protein [Gammaproteobacteria bacterium]MBU1468814.1 VOC family protein [Gammaproteobacteria bacterium]MBU2022389.1 VOC family protein [Gammaproteobacteria bacterium]MBU2239461.1 VOC family protein [Gammaproteobacteria bacterium]MBU2412151.1 VOC family protein [Gammaproteobacteria bacterium]